MLAEGVIGTDEFAHMFGFAPNALPEPFLRTIGQKNTAWRAPTRDEVEAYVFDFIRRIHTDWDERSPLENQIAFDNGWRENLQELRFGDVSLDKLKPKYFRQNKHLRYNKALIVSDNLGLEHDLFVLARQLIFAKYLSPHKTIYEFGCGSCANLLLLSELFPEKVLHGLDWSESSVNIANLLAQRMGRALSGGLLDMLAPPETMELAPNSAVLTVHALEQLGTRHGPLLQFLLRAKPGIVVNYEPIEEFYEEGNLYDYLAMLYSRKRGYLSGYYSALRELESAGKIEIIEARRPCLGGILHEASLVVWRPI